jgi:endonuclease YncB( thermonuclease family)
MNRGFNEMIDPTRPSRAFALDLETTGLIQGYSIRPHGDVGISQFALREMGTSNAYMRYTNLLQDPLGRYDAGKIDATTYAEQLERQRPGGTRWQKGYKTPSNVLYKVHERHVTATRAAAAGTGARLATETELVEKMTRLLESGHKVKGWNVEFDMLMMSHAAARQNPAVQMRWTRAVNIARNRGMVEDMGSNVRKIAYLAAQESFMSPKFNKEVGFQLGQLDPNIRWQVETGQLGLKDIERLTYDKLIEPHKGFQEFFAHQRSVGPMSYERYLDWLAEKRGMAQADRIQTFAMGRKFPDVRYTKVWSADIIAHALAPDAEREAILHGRAAKLLGRQQVRAHEALSDTALEEVIGEIFRTDAKNWRDAWKDIQPRLREYGIENEQQFFHRMRSGIEWKSRSQLAEAALETSRVKDNRWVTNVLRSKLGTAADAAEGTARAAASQPQTLRKIYAGAWDDIARAGTTFAKRHPYAATALASLAAFTVADAILPDRRTNMRGVRDSDSPYATIDGIGFGPYAIGSKRALTDFGSGRMMDNPQTRGFNELAAYRASLAFRFPDRDGVKFSDLEKAYYTWTSARAQSVNRMFHRGDYKVVKGAVAGVPGINRDAWVGMIDLKDFKVKVDDADTIALERRGLFGALHKPIMVRLAGIDAPEVEHPFPPEPRIEEDQFAGKQAGEYLESLIERQQSLRLLIDPSARTYNRHVGVLVGDRKTNLNLALVRAGAAAALPWSKEGIVRQQTFAEVEAQAARGGVGMWASKGWQMHRAMGLIAGQRVTNTTLASLRRLTKSATLSSWYGLVQRAHDSKEPWSKNEMQQMYQVGLAHRAEVMGAVNQRTREIGYMPGLRRAVNPWQIVGHGISPSRMAHGNVSAFSSGRAELNPEQIFQNEKQLQSWAKTARRVVELSHEIKMPASEVLHLQRAMNISEGITDPIAHHITETIAGYSKLEDIPIRGNMAAHHYKKLRELEKLGNKLLDEGLYTSNIYDMIKGGRTDPAATLIEIAEVGHERTGRMAQMAEARKAVAHGQTVAAPPPSQAVKQSTYQSAALKRVKKAEADVVYHRVHNMAKMAYPEPIAGKSAHLEPPRPTPPPKAIKHASATSQARPPTISRAVKSSSARAHAGGGWVGIALAGLAAFSVGSYINHRRRERDRATEMVGSSAYNPNEFVAMKPFGDFVGSHKAQAWADHHAMGDAAQARQRNVMTANFAVQGLMFFIHQDKPFSHFQAWEYFYEGKGLEWNAFGELTGKGKRAAKQIKKVRNNLYKRLKKQGYSDDAVHAWFKAMKVREGFVAKISRTTPGGKGWISKLTSRFSWEGIREWGDKAGAIMKNKKSVITKTNVAKVKEWFQNLMVRPAASEYGITAQEYIKRAKMGKLGKPAREISRLTRKADAFKYLWKHLVTDAQGFGAKALGVAEIFGMHSSCPWERMKIAHQEKLLAKVPKGVMKPTNIFTKAGGKMTDYFKKSTKFAEKFPRRATQLMNAGKSIEKFGLSKAGRLLGRVPIMNAAFGLLEGYALMDQYENATKGFVVESAAGTAKVTVEMALIRPSIWVAAGAKGAAAGGSMGSAIPGVGTAIGAAVGATIGFIGAAVVNLAGALLVSEAVGGVVRGGAKAMLGARKRRMPDPATYIPPQDYFPEGPAGFQTMRRNSPQQWSHFSGMGMARPDLSPFASAYNPIRGQDIDSRTLQITTNKRRVTARRQSARPLGMFKPTFGLVNYVLWPKRNRSKVRSVTERRNRVKRDVNSSRMMARAA